MTGADEGKKKSARDRAAGSGTGDAAKPVPIGRSFHEDIPSPGSGPANVLKKRVIPSRDANEGADVAGSDDELEAQLEIVADLQAKVSASDFEVEKSQFDEELERAQKKVDMLKQLIAENED